MTSKGGTLVPEQFENARFDGYDSIMPGKPGLDAIGTLNHEQVGEQKEETYLPTIPLGPGIGSFLEIIPMTN